MDRDVSTIHVLISEHLEATSARSRKAESWTRSLWITIELSVIYFFIDSLLTSRMPLRMLRLPFGNGSKVP